MCGGGGGGGNEPFLLLLDYAVLKRLGGGTVFGLCFIEGGVFELFLLLLGCFFLGGGFKVVHHLNTTYYITACS